ncbi:MAG: hypothetical protein IJ072_01325, partial [Oscillospiraceae bacterium]|nr:hypothetical protein [Oscillospiraceae bacterium]
MSGDSYDVGEEITYDIVVANDGNVPLENVVVKDPATGEEYVIERLEPGESVTISGSDVVTEEDVKNGGKEIKLAVTAESDNDDLDETTIENAGFTAPTMEKRSHVTVTVEVTSKPKNGTEYTEGEQVNFVITVTNDGNLTTKDIEIINELTGNKFNIAELKPGETLTFKDTYTVTAADAEKGGVEAKVTATGISTDPDDNTLGSEPATVKISVQKTQKAVSGGTTPKTGDN